MSKKLLIFPILLISICFFSCSNIPKPKIGFCMHEVKLRWEKDKQMFIKQVELLGGEVIVTNANNDETKQLEQALELIQEGVKVLVVIPENSRTARKIVKLAHKNGVKVIAYDRLILNCKLDYYVGFDAVKVGEIQANYVVNLKNNLNVVMIGGGINDQNSTLIHLGQSTIFSPYIANGKIKIIFDHYTNNWNKKEGFEFMETAIQKGERIDVILAANDNLAEGAIEAINKNKIKNEIIIVGQDADLKACVRILNDKQAMTVYKPIQHIAFEAAKVAMKFAKKQVIETKSSINNGEKDLVPSTIITQMYPVTKENIETTVLFDKFHSREDISQ